MNKPFTDVEFAREYPTHEVAEHEVLLTFNGDSDAVAFHDWWHDVGAKQFQSWLEKEIDDADED